MALSYRLIKFSTLTINRYPQIQIDEFGEPVEGTPITFEVKAKVQPLRDVELLQFPEDQRTRGWIKLYLQADQSSSPPVLRPAQQGVNGGGPDEFEWQGYVYEVMKERNYDDSCIDHTRVFAARKEVTPN